MSHTTLKRIATLSLALALPLVFAAPTLAQQDTTRAGQGMMMRRGMHQGMHQGGAMMGPGMMRMGANHVGPGMLLNLKSELELNDQQVGQLTKLREDHHSLMQAMHQNMTDLRDKMIEARGDDDFSALEQLIDERAELHANMAKSRLNVERQALDVLSADQRQKVETWREGARLFRRGHMHRGTRQGPRRGGGFRR